jgi:hypothetical protein
MPEQALHSPILAPLVTLVLWTFVMWAWLYATRIPAIRKNKIVLDPQPSEEEFKRRYRPTSAGRQTTTII